MARGIYISCLDSCSEQELQNLVEFGYRLMEIGDEVDPKLAKASLKAAEDGGLNGRLRHQYRDWLVWLNEKARKMSDKKTTNSRRGRRG